MKIKILCFLCVMLLGNSVFGCISKDNTETNLNEDGYLSLPKPGGEQKNEQEKYSDNKDKNDKDSDSGKNDSQNNFTQVTGEGDNPDSQNNGETTEPFNPNEVSDPAGDELLETEEWMLILVNPWNRLPEDFDVEMTKISGSHYIDSRAYEDYAKMMEDMRAEGLSPLVCSSYRTMEKQTTLYNNQVTKYKSQGYTQANAEAEAGKWVAVPGTSEHHTGLALDIVATSYQMLDKAQEDTAEQKWLMKNSYKYGFILRYPSDKSDITGIYYEPWHYRYVGKKAARQIYQMGICLEEYLGRLHG